MIRFVRPAMAALNRSHELVPVCRPRAAALDHRLTRETNSVGR